MEISQKIKWHQPDLDASDLNCLVGAFNSGWISNGPSVTEFENKVCAFTGAKHGLAVCNGTAALHLAMLGLDIQKNDEVIVPSFTFIAPASITSLIGAKVVNVDICKDSWCIDPESVMNAVSSKTKAIVAVHTYGNMANMDDLLKISRDTGIPIIEDAAESFGSTYNNVHSGTIGNIGIYSFHATKNITTGEGGMVLTSDTALYKKMCALREHGMKKRRTYWHDYAGHNFRLTNLQAALGCSQMRKIKDILDKKNKLYALYAALFLKDNRFTLQKIDKKVSIALWAFAVLLNFDEKCDVSAMKKRDAIIEKLSLDGIETRPGFIPLSDLPPFQKELKCQPISSRISSRIIVMPSHTGITAEQARFIYDRLVFHYQGTA